MKDKKKKLLTRQTLLLKVRDQYDDSSWQEFSNYYAKYIYAVLHGLNVDYDDIEDLKQAILLKLWKKLPTFDYDPEKGSFRSWLCTIIRNTAFNYFDKKKRKVLSGNDDSVDAEIEELADREWMIHIASLAWESIKEDFSESVRDVYARLSKGQSPEEIANETGVVRGSVYVYKERVQKALRKEVRRLNKELG